MIANLHIQKGLVFKILILVFLFSVLLFFPLKINAVEPIKVGLPCNQNPNKTLTQINNSRQHAHYPSLDGYAFDLQTGDECSGTDVVASISGSIRVFRRDDSAYCPSNITYNGNVTVIEITDSNGVTVQYLHHEPTYTATVSDGYVNAGEKLTTIGMTGCATGKHIHFEVYKNGSRQTYSQWEFAPTQQSQSAAVRNDYNGDGKSDIGFVKNISSTQQSWYVSKSNGSTFATESQWQEDFGNAGDKFFTGDFNGDKKTDLALVRDISETQQTIYTSLSSGSGFGSSQIWQDDFGNRGDKWFVGDFDGNGDDDFALVRPISSVEYRWYVVKSSGSGFGASAIWQSDFGNQGDEFFIGDFDGDGKDDISAVRKVSSVEYRWYVAKSTGSNFGTSTTWQSDFGNQGDKFFIGDFNGDGRDDISAVRPVTSVEYRWYVGSSNGSSFGPATVWSSDFGNAGDNFFVGDYSGDGRDDISAVRSVSSTQQRVYVSKSTGSAFGTYTTWSEDVGDQGDKYF